MNLSESGSSLLMTVVVKRAFRGHVEGPVTLSQASAMFDPPSRSKQFVEYGVNQDS